MKYALLSVATEKSINIGDYIQALASSQFLPSIDGFIERERLDEYDGDEVKIILNGWYMHQPEHWPPSSKIKPLFVAFHLNNLANELLKHEDSLAYLRQHQPIGCRDKVTVGKLQSAGISAYFTGCMTLTLGYKYKNSHKDGKVYFTDSVVTFGSRWEKIRCLFSLKNLNSKRTIYKKMFMGEHFRAVNWCIAVKFYNVYSRWFDRNMLLSAEYVCQQSERYNKFKTPEALLSEAERLVKGYAKASCVVTSRIHCALPCLGLETPVIYVNDDLQDDFSSCRLDGLLQLFNVLHWTGIDLKPDFEYDTNKKLSVGNFPSNKADWKALADVLRDTCEKFVI